jgi:hypothetical protein
MQTTITTSTQSGHTALTWLTDAGVPAPVAGGMVAGARARPGREFVTPPFVARVTAHLGETRGGMWHPAHYTVERPHRGPLFGPAPQATPEAEAAALERFDADW